MNHVTPFMVAIKLFALVSFLAEEPKIEVAPETPVYVPVQVKVAGGAANSTSLIEVGVPVPYEKQTGDHSMEFGAAPGTYNLTAIYVEIVSGKPKVRKLKATTKIVGVVPVPPDPPNPGPGPQPDPPPGPITPSKIWVVVVEETEQAAANRGAMFGDSMLNNYMKSKGHRWRIVDKDVKGLDGLPPADVKRFLDLSRGSSYPSVFFVDEKGKTRGRATIGANDTAANFLGILQKLDGSK